MPDFKDDDKLRQLRERLYARGTVEKRSSSFSLQPLQTKESADGWPKIKTAAVPESTPEQNVVTQSRENEAVPEHTVSQVQSSEIQRYGTAARQTLNSATIVASQQARQAYNTVKATAMAPKTTRSRYRVWTMFAGIGFFVLAIIISSVLFLLGGNNISGDNIVVSVSGPFAIGGGEALPLQIGVTNQNTIPIEAATLIIIYPPGTKSADEGRRDIFNERLSLDTISPGETLNVPLRAVVFGEENEEKVIQVEVEYRVEGSNSTFAKKAEPYRFKISSSPVSMQIESMEKISSGQETEIAVSIKSNSSNTLHDIVLRAEYPVGFTYVDATPRPNNGRSVWRLETLEPEQTVEIKLRGVLSGAQDDEYAVQFSLGVPTSQDATELASVFSTALANFTIEKPFLDVALKINRQSESPVVIDSDDSVEVSVDIANTLSETLYDARITVSLSGNALSDYAVSGNDGFYDSAKRTVTWEGSSVDKLRELKAGGKTSVSFSLKPDPNTTPTPQLAFDVDVYGRRVSEREVSEVLIGSATGEVKINSEVTLTSEVGRDTSVFDDTGPIPPRAEQTTTYTVSFLVENTTNTIGDVVMQTTLPPYVQWLSRTTGAGEISYNETSRTVTWNAGSVEVGRSKIANFQIALTPSKSQIGQEPILIRDQQLTATDRFTDQVLRAFAREKNTRLAEEMGFGNNAGQVLEGD